MSGDLLPKPLQTTLDMLLMENQLLSWHIKGGEHFTQVSIRFSTTAIERNTCDVKYRRTPPSRTIRDSVRAKDHHKHVKSDLHQCGDTDNIPIVSDTQHHTIEETNKHVNTTVQGSSTVLPLLAPSIDIPSSDTSRV